MDDNNLDSLGKEVSSLGRVLGRGKGGGELGDNISSGVERLAEKSENGNHGKTAMLDLLGLLIGILLRGVIELEGVVCARVSNTDITADAVGTLLLDADDTLVLNPRHTSDDLVDGKVGHVVDGLKGVGVRVSIDSSEVGVSGDGSESSGPDESEDRELGDTSVGELGLSEPLKVGHKVSLLVDRVVELGETGSGEADGVETDISGQGAIKSVRAGSVRKGLGTVIELDAVEGGGGGNLGRGGESSGRTGEESEGSDLHHDLVFEFGGEIKRKCVTKF